MKKIALFALLLSFFQIGCKKDYDEINQNKIEDYLKAKGLNAQTTSSGLHYIIENAGTGDAPTDTSEVTVSYKGYLLSDKVFGQSDSAYFYLNEVIKGWKESVKLLRPGGSGRFFLPASIAYGANGAGSVIPANEPIAFDIKLIGIDLVEKANRAEIRAYAAKKGWKLDSLPTGLYYVIDTPGTGNNPTANSTVTVDYKGYFTSGTVFDGTTTQFSLKNVIAGWQQGIPLFKKGGKGKLLLPSRLAYGSSGTTGIAPGKVLIFDINLIDFQ